MHRIFGTAMRMVLAAGLIMCLSSPVAAQDQELSDADIDLLIGQFLPAGITLDNADQDELTMAVYRAVSDNPHLADRIAARAVQVRPEFGEAIVEAAVRAAPGQSEAIAAAAAAADPDQARGLTLAAERTAGQVAAERDIERAMDRAAREGISPPARDDDPSPVRP